MRKYKFTKNALDWNGYKLRQIQAVRDFGNVRKGDLGGWICYDAQLSHEGDCWIGEDSRIGYGVTVDENAQLIDSWIFGDCSIRNRAVLDCVNCYIFGRVHHTIESCDCVTSILQNWYSICYSGYEIANGKKEHYISVGCQVHKVSDWMNENFRNTIIRRNLFPKSKVESFLNILKFICQEHKIKI